MNRHITDEKTGIRYTLQGDYYLPDFSLPPEEDQPIGVWGQRHLRYIREYRKELYFSLVTSGKLSSYLAGIDQQAQEMYLRLVEQMAEREGITEEIKVKDQIKWVQRMNNVADRAREVVNAELIYS